MQKYAAPSPGCPLSPSSVSSCCPLPGLILTSLPNLGLEPTLDRINRTPRPTALARNEENTVLLTKESIGRLAGLARNVLDEVATEDVLDLFLLEAAFDDEASGTIDGAGGTHFGEEELNDVLRLQAGVSMKNGARKENAPGDASFCRCR